jgi:hypothetical protein
VTSFTSSVEGVREQMVGLSAERIRVLSEGTTTDSMSTASFHVAQDARELEELLERNCVHHYFL